MIKIKLKTGIRENNEEYLRSRYGDVLFGDERGLDEPNTEVEDDLAQDIANYIAHWEDLSPVMQRDLLKMVKADKYRDVLSIPEKYHFAWRSLFFLPEELHSRFRVPKSSDFYQKKKDFFIVNGSWPMKVHTTSNNATEAFSNSWTVSPEAIVKFSKNSQYEIKEENGEGFICILESDLDNTRNHFILNPDIMSTINNYYGVGLDWEREIWQIRPTTASRVIFVRVRNGDYDKNEGKLILSLLKRGQDISIDPI